MGEYSVRDKAWAWPEKWRRWKEDFARSERVPEPWEAALLRWDGEADLDPEMLARLAAWDWEQYKFDQLSELRECTFWLREYRSPSADWDHDHCLGCWAKFIQAGHSREADILHEGYVTYLTRDVPTKVRIPMPRGVSDLEDLPVEPLDGDGMAAEWVCKSCFDQFRQLLGFNLAEQ